MHRQQHLPSLEPRGIELHRALQRRFGGRPAAGEELQDSPYFQGKGSRRTGILRGQRLQRPQRPDDPLLGIGGECSKIDTLGRFGPDPGHEFGKSGDAPAQHVGLPQRGGAPVILDRGLRGDGSGFALSRRGGIHQPVLGDGEAMEPPRPISSRFIWGELHGAIHEFASLGLFRGFLGLGGRGRSGEPLRIENLSQRQAASPCRGVRFERGAEASLRFRGAPGQLERLGEFRLGLVVRRRALDPGLVQRHRLVQRGCGAVGVPGGGKPGAQTQPFVGIVGTRLQHGAGRGDFRSRAFGVVDHKAAREVHSKRDLKIHLRTAHQLPKGVGTGYQFWYSQRPATQEGGSQPHSEPPKDSMPMGLHEVTLRRDRREARPILDPRFASVLRRWRARLPGSRRRRRIPRRAASADSQRRAAWSCRGLPAAIGRHRSSAKARPW